MDAHTHGPGGEYIPLTSEPEVATDAAVEAAAEVAETTAEASVEIAKVEADRDVKLAEKDVEREQIWQESRVATLEGELRGIKETLERLAPPEPPPAEPVVVVPEPSEPALDTAPAPDPDTPPEPPANKKSSRGFWGDAYR